jgi:transcriptional regulator with XRE-family HTH domain
MDMIRCGRGIRALRLRRRWRQQDLADAAGVSQSTVARIELGKGGGMPLERLAKVANALGATVIVRLNWNGEALDRLLDQEHAGLVETVATLLRKAGWEVRAEVTFWIRGERGSVDIAAWHAASRTLLIVEIKSVVPDQQAMLSALDRKGRLGGEIVASLGWRPATISRLLVIGASRTARRRVSAHQATFDAALPDRYLKVRHYVVDPAGLPPLRGLIFVSGSRRLTTRHRQSRGKPST